MTTTKEFKARHDLSDSAFKRLVTRVLTVHPHLAPITERSGSTVWTVRHEQVLEAYLATDRVEATVDSSDANSYSEAFGTTDTATVTVEAVATPTATPPTVTPLSSKLATLSTRFGNSAKHSAMSSLARVERPVDSYIVPTADDIESRNASLSLRQADIDTFDGVIATVVSEVKARTDITEAQEREEQRKKRKQELQRVRLDEVRRVLEEQQERKRIREALDNGIDIADVLADDIDAVSQALD